MINRIIGLIVSVILILTVILFDESLIGNVSENDGKYSVYIDSVYYGNITDREPFDNYITEMHKKYNEESPYGEVYAPENYTIDSVAGAIGSTRTEEEILEIFKDKVEFLIDGYKVNIVKGEDAPDEDMGTYEQGGEVQLTSSSNHSIVYSTSKEEVDRAFDRIIETFVDEESIERIARGEQIEAYQIGMEETLEYKIGGVVIGTEEKVPYDKVMVGNELYNKMLFYNVPEDRTYEVQPGDTLKEIANKNMLNVNELVAANDVIVSENTILSPGQEIIVNLVDPVVTVESKKVIVAEEEVPNETEIIEDDTMLTTAANIIQDEGKTGKVVRVYEVEYLNGQTTSTGKIVSENQIEAPRNRVVVKGTKQAPSYTATYSSSGIAGYTKSTGTADGTAVAWGKATQGGYLSSPFGPRWGAHHDGIDIAGLPNGSTIMTVYDGVVVYTGYQGARGNLVIVDHQNGYVTYYQHLSSIDVQVGQSLVKGQRVGGMGNTGFSFGVHLHFEVFVNGQLVDPQTVVTWH